MNNLQVINTDSVMLSTDSSQLYTFIPDSGTINILDSIIYSDNQEQISNFDTIANNTLLQDTLQLPGTLMVTDSACLTIDAKPELIIKERIISSSDWIVGVLLVLVLTVGWIKLKFGKLFTEILTASLSARKTNNLYLSQNTLLNKVTFTLSSVFYFTIGLFVTEIIKNTNTRIYGINLFYVFIAVSFIIGLLIFIKIISYKLTGYLFNIKNDINEYLYNGTIISIALMIILLPLVILLPFISQPLGDAIIYIGLFALLLLYFVQLFRGLQIVIKNNRGIIYPILYFLGLELAPILILIKFARSIF